MNHSSKACDRALDSLQECFPSLALPSYVHGQSLDFLLNTITQSLPIPDNLSLSISRLKAVCDAQEYRIQRSQLSVDIPPCLTFLDDICEQIHSTNMGCKSIFSSEQHMDGNLIDQVWWTMEKKDQSFDFID